MKEQNPANLLATEQQLANELAALTGKPWEHTFTGGCCTALELITKQTPTDTHYLMVTHSEDASVPAANEPHTLGEYVDNKADCFAYCEALSLHYFTNRAELVAYLNGKTK